MWRNIADHDIIASHKSHTSICTFTNKVSPEIYNSEYQNYLVFVIVKSSMVLQLNTDACWFNSKKKHSLMLDLFE